MIVNLPVLTDQRFHDKNRALGELIQARNDREQLERDLIRARRIEAEKLKALQAVNRGTP